MSARSQKVQSVRRAISILRSFTVESPNLGVTEISRRTGLHKSTVYRLLETLEAERLISRDPDNGRFRLGVGLIALAGRVLLHMDLRQASRRHMRILADRIEETVNLAVLDNSSSLNIEQALPVSHLVKNYGWIGRRTPVHATSTGKILLAWLAEEERRAALALPLEVYTSHTISSLEALLTELNQVRNWGYALGSEEYEVGLNAVAAPIRNHDGEVVAALSASGPSYRLTPERFEETALQVMETAQIISGELGFVSDRALPDRGSGGS